MSSLNKIDLEARLFEMSEVYVKALGDVVSVRRYAMMKWGCSSRTATRYIRAVEKQMRIALRKMGIEPKHILRQNLARAIQGAMAEKQYAVVNGLLSTYAKVEGLVDVQKSGSDLSDGEDRLAPVGAWVPNERRHLSEETETEGEA